MIDDSLGSNFNHTETMIPVIHTKIAAPDAAFYLIPYPGLAVTLKLFTSFYFTKSRRSKSEWNNAKQGFGSGSAWTALI
jgi:hypothetical protein